METTDKAASIALWEQYLDIEPNVQKPRMDWGQAGYLALLSFGWMIGMILLLIPIYKYGVQTLSVEVPLAAFVTFFCITAWKNGR